MTVALVLIGITAVCAITVLVMLIVAARRPLTETDRVCAEIDQELDREAERRRRALTALDGLGEECDNVIAMWPHHPRDGVA